MNFEDQSKTEQEINEKAEQLLKQLTLSEKISLFSGIDNWHTAPIERLGIPSLTMTDGPNGVRADPDGTGRIEGPTTAFPTGVSMASSWNPEAVAKATAAMAEETRGMGCDVLLGPCVNIVRTPLAGRNFEAFSEDPYLAGRTGAGYVNGLQSKNVGASLKHFAVNNQEINRLRSSSEVDERTLREIYLPAFETVVKETKPWTVMTSYNKINGVYASENAKMLRDILEGEWGFEGVVVSDWGANHSTIPAKNSGLDIEMPGPAKYFGDLLEQAVYNWQVPEAVIDASARRILRMIVRSGAMDEPSANPSGSVNTPAHTAAARALAEEAITLLKNDQQVLPLDAAHLKKVAVIGPNAADLIPGGEGSSRVKPLYVSQPLHCIQDKMGDKVLYAQGCTNLVAPPVVRSEFFTPSEGTGHGLTVRFYNNVNFEGEPAATNNTQTFEFFWYNVGPSSAVNSKQFSAVWTGTMRVPESGVYTFLLGNTERCKVCLDGEQLVENYQGHVSMPTLMNDPMSVTCASTIELEAGKDYDFRGEYIWTDGDGIPALRLMYLPPDPVEDPIAKAVEAARQADVALVFAGMPMAFESEGDDRPNMKLPGPQDELIRAVAKANPKTVVVLNAGAPVEMPWVDEVAGVVIAYYPGQEGGSAITNVLFGDVNPSGKLPITLPKRYEDNPAYINYPGAQEVHYGEGIFVGYRYYDYKKIEPLFPFGHGLSYTTFEYSDLQVPGTAAKGQPVTVQVTVKNTGERAGKEVVQVYVRDVEASQMRPLKELKRFEKVALQPGESKTLSFTLDERALSFYDPYRGGWVAEPGKFEVLVGSSSRDIRQQATFLLEE